MDFALTEEQEMIRDAAREFAQKEIVPVAADFDETGALASYFLYDSKADMDEAFRAARVAAGVTDSGDACFRGGHGEFSTYGYDDDSTQQAVGSITCYPRGDRAVILWTHTDDQVMARAARKTDSVAELMDWWMTGAPGPCDGPC